MFHQILQAAILSIKFEAIEDASVQISVVDVLGKEVLSNQVSPVIGSNTTNIDMSSLPSGSYFVNLNNGKEILTSKVVKQ